MLRSVDVPEKLTAVSKMTGDEDMEHILYVWGPTHRRYRITIPDEIPEEATRIATEIDASAENTVEAVENEELSELQRNAVSATHPAEGSLEEIQNVIQTIVSTETLADGELRVSGLSSPPKAWTQTFGPMKRFSLDEDTNIESLITTIKETVLQSVHYDVEGISIGYVYKISDQYIEKLCDESQSPPYWDIPKLYLWPGIHSLGYIFENRWGSYDAPILDPPSIWFASEYLKKDNKKYIAENDVDAWRQAVTKE
ncbi:MAG: hypothetical protein ABEI86_01075 [Halobacteriaceae archaeon]